jgi:CubicO group peptidase (beta-lactamase class C family)
MTLTRRHSVIALAFAASTFAAPIACQQGQSRVSVSAFPGATWDSIRDARAAGWSRNGLDSVRTVLSTYATTGMVAVVGGRVLMTYGNIDTVTYLASARKSVLSLLFGKYVRSGVVGLDKSLAQLGMDDIGGLSDQEKEATVRDLITARSGIYHLASNPGDDTRAAPPRGSVKHGAYYLYNNWDFNALGGVFEKVTGRDIYDALESDIARPIGMQDFDRSIHRKSGDTTRSQYKAYHMNLSTRDMARLGLLALRRGNWNGTQVVPAEWVDESTRAFTHSSAMNPEYRRNGPFGYGYLWWVWEGPRSNGVYKGSYSAQGAFGQYIVIVPELDLVVAHKTKPDQRTPNGDLFMVGDDLFFNMLDLLVRSHCGEKCPSR